MDNDTLIISLIVLGYAAGMLGFWHYWQSRLKRRAKFELDFVRTLINGILNGSVRTLKDVEAFYSAFFDTPQLSWNSSERIGILLRKALIRPSTPGETSAPNMIETFLPVIQELIDAHSLQLAEARKELPFAGTPSPERELLQDISALSGQSSSVVQAKLEELGKAVRIREETMRRLSDENGKSLAWARWGTIGTVVFSVVSIVLGVWGLMKT